MRFTSCSSVALLVAGMSACVPMRSRQRYDYNDTAQAERRGDLEFLQRACRGEVTIDFPEEACGAAQRVTALKTATCDSVRALHDQTPPDKRNVGVYDHGMAVHFARCGQFDAVFERSALRGAAFLRGLEDEDGQPLEQGFVAYATEHPGPRFLPRTLRGVPETLKGVFDWLGKKPERPHCALLLAAVAGRDTPEDWRQGATASWLALDYAYQAKCREAAPAAEAALLDENAAMRIKGSQILGEVGDARVARKLAILADTDPVSTVEEQAAADGTWSKTVYPVRDTCAGALGKLRLRTAD